MPSKFTWIKTYKAIANTVYEFRHRRDEFFSLFCELFDPDGKDGKFKFPTNGSGGEGYLAVDPFTFFGTFNRGRYSEGNNEARRQIIEKVIERLSIDAPVPSDFDGVPLCFNMSSWFFHGDPQTVGEGDVDRLWDLFVAAIDFADHPSDETRAAFIELFDKVRVQKQVKWNITFALFWIRPDAYLGFDSVNRDYLERNYSIVVKKQPSAEQYLSLTQQAAKVTGVPLHVLSDNAFVTDGYWPAKELYDPKISADTWLSLLHDESVFSKNSLTVLMRFMDNGGKGSCTALAARYGYNKNFYNANISTTSEKVAAATDCILPPDKDEKSRWWPIMCVGKYVKVGKTSQYEWKLRTELQEALGMFEFPSLPLYDKPKDISFNPDKLGKLIALYKQDHHKFRGPDVPDGDQESYKWNYFRNYKENWDIDAKDFEASFVAALKPASIGQGALLGNGWEYPYSRLAGCLKANPDAVREAFIQLYDPEKDLREAYGDFTEAMDEMIGAYNDSASKQVDSMDQKPAAVSLYLSFEFPERYFFYKPTLADSFAEFIGAKLSPDPVEKFFNYEALCEKVLPFILEDEELIKLNDSVLTPEQREADPAYHLLLQDITFYCSAHLNDWHPDAWSQKEEVVKHLALEGDIAAIEPKNIILYGPPGTGKTYNLAAAAWLLSQGRDVSLDELRSLTPEEREAARAWYNEQIAKPEGGQVAFTTFHQSYGYEEFIEGIRPVLPGGDGDEEPETSGIRYSYENGIFKSFCLRASDSAIENKAGDFGFNDSPTVWKVSLMGTGDNPVRAECLAKGHIRIGWDEYGPNVTDKTDFKAHGGKAVLSAFMTKMRKGDIVLSCYSSTTIDAIGVVTGDAEWHNEYEDYKRLREVEWIAKGLDFDIVEAFGVKPMTLSTVYRLKLGVAEAMRMLEKVDVSSENLPKDSVAAKPYIFIIDEINRGNISKVFGELITLIETSKREGMPEQQSAILPYTKEPFSVPRNVHIIGTMNTADRSTALMDSALRRRFSFIELLPDASLLEGVEVEGVDLERLMSVMNERIELLYDREHTIGHSYFMRLGEDATISDLARVFDDNVIPLLQEYFFDDYGRIRAVLGAAANWFFEKRGADGLFAGDDGEFQDLITYKRLPAPLDPDAYKLIYQQG